MVLVHIAQAACTSKLKREVCRWYIDGKTSCDCLLASFAQCALANTQLARMRRQPRSLLKGQKPQAIKAARKLAVDWVVKNAAASIYEGFSVGDLVRLVSSETVSACFSWIRNVSANVFRGHFVFSVCPLCGESETLKLLCSSGGLRVWEHPQRGATLSFFMLSSVPSQSTSLR